jgi:hypothetical protein
MLESFVGSPFKNFLVSSYSILRIKTLFSENCYKKLYVHITNKIVNILFHLTCESGRKSGGGSSGSGSGSQIVPEELPHSIRLLLARSNRLINTADVSEKKKTQ